VIIYKYLRDKEVRMKQKKKPPDRTAWILAIVAAVLSIIDNLLEIVKKLLTR